MKQYCKRVNIRSIYFIKHCIYACLDGKWTRRDVHELLAEFSEMDGDEVGRYARDLSERSRLFPVIDTLAAYIQKCLKNHDIHLRRARIRRIQDGIAQKQRNICIASMLQ